MIEANKENYEKYLIHQRKNHLLTLVSAQTSLGKTSAYEKVIKNAYLDKFIIALPTNELKHQVYNDLVNMGVTDIMETPEIPEINDQEIKEEYFYLMQIGAVEKRKEFLNNAVKELEEQTEKETNEARLNKINADINNITYYLAQNETVNHFEGHIVTTWARLFYLHWCLVYTHKLIIDEDILRECIKVKTYSLAKLRKTCNILENNYKDRLQKKEDIILKAPYKQINAVEPIYQKNMSQEEIEDIEEEVTNLHQDIYNIFDILSISAIYKYNPNKEKMKNSYNDDDLVHCLICRDIPFMTTYVLSATMEKDFYIKYFEDRDIEYIKIPHDKYMGKLLQDYSYSYSRTCLDNSPQILEEIRRKYPNTPLITFKKFCNEGNYNFGAIEGLNNLEGQDIVVVGMPYLNDIVYKFFLYSLYGEIITEDRPHYQRIENDEYSFKITTYSNEHYQKIITYFLQSEIEQAVGRARLLRYNCTVHLFSGFPAEQAEFVKDLEIDVTSKNEEELESKNSEETAMESKDL